MKGTFLNFRFVIATVAVFLVLSVLMFSRSSPGGCVSQTDAVHQEPVYLKHLDIDSQGGDTVRNLQNELRFQRNVQTRLLNEQRRKIGQLDCENAKDKEANSLGGWCRESSKEDGGQHMTDMKLVEALSKFFANKYVGSFGDGPGAYKRELLKLGQVKGYDAFDGAPYCEETSDGRVKFMDLTIPQYGLRMYDWVMSLEVAEHIPKEFEAVYIDNLVRHAREGIVMSWAVPDQGGLAHINLRPFKYVVDLLKHYGFSHDPEKSKILQNSSSFQWLQQNINVFRRVNTTNMAMLEYWFT